MVLQESLYNMLHNKIFHIIIKVENGCAQSVLLNILVETAIVFSSVFLFVC